jgi:hypothetical protein
MLESRAYPLRMEWEDVRLLPAELLLTMSGIAALMLGFGAAIEGLPFAPLLGVLTLILLVAGASLAPQRRWSLRLGSVVAWAAIPVWFACFIALDRPNDASTGLFCLGMAVAAGWTSRFLRGELELPEWLREYEPSDQPRIPVAGWIVELADDEPLPLDDPPRLRLTPSGARTTSW